MAVLRWGGKQSRSPRALVGGLAPDASSGKLAAPHRGTCKMNTTEIVLVVLASALSTGVASFAVFRLVAVEARRRHIEVGTTIFLQAGVIYAVFLAFIFGQALTSYVDADNAIDQECAALHGASMIATALPAKQRAEIKDALQTYIAAVLDPEWMVMRETRFESPVAETAQIALLEQANSLDLDPRYAAAQGRLVGLLVEAHRDREERIFQAGQGIPSGLWVMVLVYCGVLVGLVFFSSLENAWSHATLSALIFGGLNVIVLLACFLLQYPFEGPVPARIDELCRNAGAGADDAGTVIRPFHAPPGRAKECWRPN